MKKIVVMLLSLITLLSLGNISVFAVLKNGDEFDLEKYKKSLSKRHISEQTKNSAMEAFLEIKKENPSFNDNKICKIISKDFNIPIYSVRHFSMPLKSYDIYQDYYGKNKENMNKFRKSYYIGNKEKRKKYCKQHRENDEMKVLDELMQQIYINKEISLEEIEESEIDSTDIQKFNDFSEF